LLLCLDGVILRVSAKVHGQGAIEGDAFAFFKKPTCYIKNIIENMGVGKGQLLKTPSSDGTLPTLRKGVKGKFLDRFPWVMSDHRR